MCGCVYIYSKCIHRFACACTCHRVRATVYVPPCTWDRVYERTCLRDCVVRGYGCLIAKIRDNSIY